MSYNRWMPVEYSSELYHHGIKGQRWGVRRFQPYQPGARVKGGKEVGVATKVKQRVTGIGDGIKQRKAEHAKADSIEKVQATRKANIKKAAIVGASIAGVCLAAYGGYKFSQWVNQQNVNLAAHAGTEFATRFAKEIAPGPPGFGGYNNHRYAIAKSKATSASLKMHKLASEKVYSQAKGPKQRIKRAFQARDISKGKKTVYDVLDYDQTVKSIMQDERVLERGQSQFAKTMRDVINLGGTYRREWR